MIERVRRKESRAFPSQGEEKKKKLAMNPPINARRIDFLERIENEFVRFERRSKRRKRSLSELNCLRENTVHSFRNSSSRFVETNPGQKMRP